MALFVVRPSRGTWGFFVLVVVGVLAVRARSKHEAVVARRDEPTADLGQNLAVCLFGADAGWVLREDVPLPRLEARWAFQIGEWFKVRATDAPTGWPRRCAPSLRELSSRLVATPGVTADVREAVEWLDAKLSQGATPRLEFLAAVDAEQVGPRVARVLMASHEVSDAARARWWSTPVDWNRYGAFGPVVTPRWRVFPQASDRVVLGSPSAVFYRDAVRGTTHRLEAAARGYIDVPVGVGVAWDAPPRGGALRAETDLGAALLTVASPSRVVPLPDGFRESTWPASLAWDASLGATATLFLARDAGTVRVWAAPSDGPLHWSEPAEVGPPESVLAAVMAPDTSPDVAAPAWRVTLVRPRVHELAVSQHVLRVTTDGPSPTIAVEGPVAQTAVAGVHPQGAHTCAAGGARYIVLPEASRMTVIRVDGAEMLSTNLLVSWSAAGADIHVRCDARRVLVGPLTGDGRGRPSLVGFPEGASPTHVELDVPPTVLSRTAALHALTLVDDGVAAVVTHEGAARVYRWSQGRWAPGGFLATLRPAADTVRAVTRVVAQAEGDDMALLLSGTQVVRRARPPAQNAEPDAPPVFDETRTTFDVVMRSRDGGRTFTTL